MAQSAVWAAAVDPDRVGWVYYALAATPTEQRVKIGFAKGVRARMHALKADSITPGAQPPTVLAVERGTLALEAQRHVEFDDLRLGRAEWFRYDERLRAFLMTLDPLDIVRCFRPSVGYLPSGAVADF